MDSSAAPPGPADGADALAGDANTAPSREPDENPKGDVAERGERSASLREADEPSFQLDFVPLDDEVEAGGSGGPLGTVEGTANREAPVVPQKSVAEPGAESGSNDMPSMTFLAIVALVVAAADVGSKEWVKRTLAGPELRRTGRSIKLIPDHLDFIFAQNPGGAWSFLRGVPDGLRRPFFLFVSSAAIVFIVIVYSRLDRRQWAMRWGLTLALGGAIGNLTDRMRYGWVVDFIDVYWKGKANDFHWPTFNVADIAIVAGLFLMALDLNFLRKEQRERASVIAGVAGTS